MSFTSWLRGLFSRRSVVRSIVRLDPVASTPIDAREEVVDLTGGPLREHSNRLAIRDRRLLPKPRPVYSPRTWVAAVTKRKRYFTRAEAARYFSGTLRTRNRAIRDLLPDAEQLQRYGLPLWKSEEDVAASLGITLRELHFFATHREATRVAHYVTFAIPKRSGGQRLIMAPKKKLKALQRSLNEQLLERLPQSAHAHGFVKGRSVRSGAAPHVNKGVVIRLDLADFFPSVTFERVRGLLIGFGYGFPVATTLAVLMTESERQPVTIDGVTYHVPVGRRHCVQGAPTSPAICNAIVTRLDRRLAGLARSLGFTYTRYADDLTFSGDSASAVARIISRAKRIVKEEGFAINEAKTRVMRRGGSQRVTNVVVNETLGVSRRERRRVRAAIHQAARSATTSAHTLRQLSGNVAYVAMLNPQQAAPLAASLARIAKGE